MAARPRSAWTAAGDKIKEDPPLISSPPRVTEATLQVFNGREGNAALERHRLEGSGSGPVLVGSLRRSEYAGDGYGRQLDLDVSSPSSGAFFDLRFTIRKAAPARPVSDADEQVPAPGAVSGSLTDHGR